MWTTPYASKKIEIKGKVVSEMEVIQKPVALAAKKGCNAKGCKKYTCYYRMVK